MISETLKGYKVLERIGAGGFGVVYRAYQSTVGREVAVKVILPGFANHLDFIRRFEMEAQLIARLEHLHIVPLYDYWRDPDGAYLVMRWLRGGSLRQALKAGPFDLQAAVLLLDQIASGLSAAHVQGVVHCDLKPSNILLDEEGNAYLADFSIARILRQSNESSADGITDYLSPEQARGEPVTPQTDIYSFGVLLYEVLTGSHPFPETSEVQRLYKHLNDLLPEIQNLPDAVRGGVNEVIQKATAKNPKHRFQSALEMAAAFRTAADVGGDLTAPTEALTPREEDIFLRIVAGSSNKEIARELFIEVTTVKWYITQIYRKLGVRSRRQAIARAQEIGFIAETETGESEAAVVSVALPKPVNPYKGLRAFDVSDARDFFGRESLIERLIAHLASASNHSRSLPARAGRGAGRFLAVVGPSGSGKSSLVKAGLIPALRRGDVPGSDQWFIVQFVPGKRPLDQLEIALTRVAADQSTNLRQHLERDPHGLLRVAGLILPQNDSDLLIVIDQFEEIFTLVEEEAQRAHFLALLSTAVSEPHSRVRIVFTLRADYYDRPLHYPLFGELLRNNMETILPLSTAELERAILLPAQQVGVGFEPGLAATIIDDVQYQSGALPLLQFALTELFEAREERTLTHAAYRRIGGAAGALARRAEELYQEQDHAGRELIHQMYLRLWSVDYETTASLDARRRVPRSELIALADSPEMVDEIIDTYAAYRLLTLDHDPDTRRPMVEVAHEALLREWDRLRGWLEESQVELCLQRQLTRMAEEWRVSNEDPSFLLRGTRLEQFERWGNETNLALTKKELDYLQASITLREERAAAEAARQARVANLELRARDVLKTLMVVFLLATLISSWFAFDANRHRREAELSFARSESQRLAAEAINILQRGGNVELASLLALHALGIYHTPQADLALQRAAALTPAPALIDAPEGAYWLFLSATPDTHYLRFHREVPIPYGRDVITEFWDIQTLERLWQVEGYVMYEYPWTIRELTADYSMLLAMTSDQEKLVLLDVDSGERVRSFTGNRAKIEHYQLSADARVVVAGTQEGVIHVWDVETGTEMRRFAIPGEIFLLAVPGREIYVTVSPDSRLAAARGAGVTYVWDIESGEILFQSEYEDSGYLPPQFVDGGRLLATVVDPVLSLWDLTTGQKVVHDIPSNFGQEGKLSPDGNFFARGFLGDASTEVALWELASRSELYRLSGHTTAAVPEKFTSDSHRLVTVGWSEGIVRLWDTATGQELFVLAGHTQSINGISLSTDDRYLATSGRDGTIRIWDLHAPLHGDVRLESVRLALYPSRDGRHILTENPEKAGAVLMDASSMTVLHHLDFSLDAFSDGGHPAIPPFSSDSQMVLGVTKFSTLLVYDVSSGRLIGEYTDSHDAYRYAAFIPNSRHIFAGGNRGAYLLDAMTGEKLQTFTSAGTRIHFNNSGFVAVSPDGRYGVLHEWTEDHLSMASLWDLKTGRLEFQSSPKYLNTIAAMTFSDDSHYFAWGDIAGDAYVFDLHSGEEVIRLSHTNIVMGIDFSSKNRLLLTSALGDSVSIWDLETGRVIRRFFTDAGPRGFVKFVEEDEYILFTAIEDGAIHRLPVSIDGLIKSMCAGVHRDLTPFERELYGLDDTPTCPKFTAR